MPPTQTSPTATWWQFPTTVSKALVLAALVSVTACRSRPIEPLEADTHVVAWATQRHLDDQVDPEAVAAYVNDEAITLGQVALCVDAEPIRTPRQCLDILIDTRLINRHATAAHRIGSRDPGAR